MPRPKKIRELQQLCRGCVSDRYNMGKGFCERPGIDAEVTVDHCWSCKPDRAIYCRPMKTWVMSCHSGQREQWITQYARTGKKPEWRPC